MRQVATEVLAAVREAHVRVGLAAWRPGESGEEVIARARAGLVEIEPTAPVGTPAQAPPPSPGI